MSRRSTHERRRKFCVAAALSLGAALAIPLALSPLLASGEVIQKRGIRLSVDGSIVPSKLPRKGVAPVAVSFAGDIASSTPGAPPQLETISVAINRHGKLNTRGLPRCRLRQISPSTTREALASCRRALIGEGSFSADVQLPEQSPFPSRGKILAFNGRIDGRPAALAHIYGTKPVPTSHVLPFTIRRTRGKFGFLLSTSLPPVTGEWGYVTGLSMTLKRRYSFKGKARSYISAGCPAPAGFRSALFPLARTRFSFAGNITLQSVLTRSCRARG